MSRMYYGSVLSYFIITDNILCQLASCFACIYVDTLIPYFKLNCTHVHCQVHYYFVWVFYPVNSSSSYQVPMSLNNLTPCLYLCIHFSPTLQVKWQICILLCVAVFILLISSVSWVYVILFCHLARVCNSVFKLIACE